MSLICFVITMVLWVSLFLYMRQRISVLEDRVALLSKLTTAVAGMKQPLREHDYQEEPDPEEDESDKSDKSDESDDESKCVNEVPLHLTMNSFPRLSEDNSVFKCVVIEQFAPMEPMTNSYIELETVSPEVDEALPKRVVSVDDVEDLTEVKTLSVEVNYESLSVKELKDKVAELNGPKLKTKKELLEFLKNKM